MYWRNKPIVVTLLLCQWQVFLSCSTNSPAARAVDVNGGAGGEAVQCELVNSGLGPDGVVNVRFEKVVLGLEVPWSVGILPGGSDWLVTERPGRIRLVRDGALVETTVFTASVAEGGEGGLLGLAIDLDFLSNSRIYIYYTAAKNGVDVNRIERLILSPNRLSATSDRIIVDDIPATVFHDGGRIKFGPDGFLYASTGDAGRPDNSRDSGSLSGKILRMTTDGVAAAGNPEPGRLWFIKGLRNVQAFDWLDAQSMIIADHGPSGEYLGRTGGDEVSVARKGDDLGWPDKWRCELESAVVTPVLSWVDAVPPGGGLFYRGDDIPQWKGSFLVGTLGSRHLHRVAIDSSNPFRISLHEVYFKGEPPIGLGRIRDVFQGLSGEVFVTTSNCDGRGSCPSDMDGIYRIKVVD
jgi:aldose sugar dehydrogenase